jgi:hypothetical protein
MYRRRINREKLRGVRGLRRLVTRAHAQGDYPLLSYKMGTVCGIDDRERGRI